MIHYQSNLHIYSYAQRERGELIGICGSQAAHCERVSDESNQLQTKKQEALHSFAIRLNFKP